jgi:hypothetical protein
VKFKTAGTDDIYEKKISVRKVVVPEKTPIVVVEAPDSEEDSKTEVEKNKSS